MGEFIILVLLLGGLAFWVLAGLNHYHSKKLGPFFINLILLIIVCFLFWSITIYPVLGCNGFLCGLGELIVFSLLAGGTFILWGLLLFFLTRGKYDHIPKTETSGEILDSDFNNNEIF